MGGIMSDLEREIITGFDLWQVSLPVTSARDHGIGRVVGTIDIVVIKLTGSSGFSGFGEGSPWSVFTGIVEASFAALNRYFRPLVVGRSLSDRHLIMRDVKKAVAHCFEAKAAIETALLDLTGQLTGLNIAALLGGAVRTEIPLSCSLANPDFNADRKLVETLLEDEVNIVKLKAGVASHHFDMMRLETLRKEYPSLDIRVDFNQGLTPADAEHRVRDVAGFSPTFIEQPVAASFYRLMARLRDICDVPLLADESVFSAIDMLRAIDEGICDGVSIKIMKSGSLIEACQISAMAEAAGLTAYGGDMFESGLAHLAGAQMIAAAPNITLGCEFYQSRYYLVEDILQTPFPIEKGRVIVPQSPGLGILVDEGRLDKYKTNFAGS